MQTGVFSPVFRINEETEQLLSVLTQKFNLISPQVASDPYWQQNNRIDAIFGTLTLSGLTLDRQYLEFVTNSTDSATFNEVSATIKACILSYEQMPALDPFSATSLCQAHHLLLKDEIPDAGQFRTSNRRIVKNNQIVHIAPPAWQIPKLCTDLFAWCRTSQLHPFLTASIFHHEFESIQPFSDGNGRIGRLWQTLMLSRWNPVFSWIPAEFTLAQHADEYFASLANLNRENSADKLISFMLSAYCECVDQILPQVKTAHSTPITELAIEDNSESEPQAPAERSLTDAELDQMEDYVERLMACFTGRSETAQTLMKRMGLTHRANFRKNYLQPALQMGKIEMTIPDKPNSRNQRYRMRTEPD